MKKVEAVDKENVRKKNNLFLQARCTERKDLLAVLPIGFGESFIYQTKEAGPRVLAESKSFCFGILIYGESLC